MQEDPCRRHVGMNQALSGRLDEERDPPASPDETPSPSSLMSDRDWRQEHGEDCADLSGEVGHGDPWALYGSHRVVDAHPATAKDPREGGKRPCSTASVVSISRSTATSTGSPLGSENSSATAPWPRTSPRSSLPGHGRPVRSRFSERPDQAWRGA